MTVTEILEQAKSLTPAERKELAKLLIDMIELPPIEPVKTGAEIVAFMESLPPIEFVDDHLTDPVEWVAAQRQKRHTQVLSDIDGDAE